MFKEKLLFVACKSFYNVVVFIGLFLMHGRSILVSFGQETLEHFCRWVYLFKFRALHNMKPKALLSENRENVLSFTSQVRGPH